MVSAQELSRRFSLADYAVFGVMLCVSALIGVYYACTGNKQSTTKEFLFGGKTMQVIPVALSVLATFVSAITLLGLPAEAYQFGLQYWMINISYLFMIPVTALVYVPVFYNLQVSSINEYIGKRFSRSLRTLIYFVSTISSLIYTSFVVYAPALVLSQVTGIHLWLCVSSIGVVCTFYTSIGGIKAVVWTDVFQTLIIFGAMLTVLGKGIVSAGGFGEVWTKAEESSRTQMLNFDPDPTVRHTFWTLSIGGFFTWLCIYAVNQALVQRSLTIPTLKGASAVIWLNLPGNIITVTLTLFLGLVIYANYSTCDPIRTKQVSNPNQMLPLFVMDTLGFLPGLPGLFVAGIFSGSLSTLSSSLNSLAAVTLEDVVKVYIAPDMTDKFATKIAKLLAFSFGVIAIVLVAIVQNLSGTVIQAALSVSGTLGGPVLGVFSLGMFFPWPNALGATAGFFSGLATSLWISIGSLLHKRKFPTARLSVDSCLDLYLNVSSITNTSFVLEPFQAGTSDDILALYKLSYLWYGAIGCIVTIVVGLLVSAVSGATDKRVIEPNIMCPMFYKLWACGKDHQKEPHDVAGAEIRNEATSGVLNPITTMMSEATENNSQCAYPMCDVKGVYKQKNFL